MSEDLGKGDHGGPSLVVLAGGLAKRYGGCKPLAPVGVHGEAVLDLTVSDALDAGFGQVVVIVGPQTGAAISYHIRESWPISVPVTLVVQAVPLGTAHALLRSRDAISDGPFAVVNADDVYGEGPLSLLLGHLSNRTAEHAMVCFELRNTIVSDKPVTRGICVVGPSAELVDIVERRQVTKRPDDTFVSEDGVEPKELEAGDLVSVNLWGFQQEIWPVLEEAVLSVHPGLDPDGTVRDPEGLKDETEVLLPEVIGDLIDGRFDGTTRTRIVRVIDGPGKCLGVTHPQDLPVVRSELASMVGRGTRPEGTWGSAR